MNKHTSIDEPRSMNYTLIMNNSSSLNQRPSNDRPLSLSDIDALIRKVVTHRVERDFYLAKRYNLSTENMTPQHGPWTEK